MRTTRVLRNFRKKALAASIASAILLGQDVLAQAVDRDIEEIAVTGTRVRMTDGMASPVPVTAVSIGDLQNFDPGGSVSEQLSNLPQFFGTQSAQRGGGILFGSGGGSYMNMRNLGAVPTLECWCSRRHSDRRPLASDRFHPVSRNQGNPAQSRRSGRLVPALGLGNEPGLDPG